MSIKVSGVRHIYSPGLPQESLALDNINFEVEDGDFVGVIGHTGSGKSTLMQHLNGLLRPIRILLRLSLPMILQMNRC